MENRYGGYVPHVGLASQNFLIYTETFLKSFPKSAGFWEWFDFLTQTAAPFLEEGDMATEYKWDSSIMTGHEKIDEQHKQLFAALNNLIRICETGRNDEELKKSLDFLNEYTIKHFFDEEQIQQKYHYPDYVNHKKYHDEFKLVVRDLAHELILKGPTESLTNEVISKIGNWLVTHIKGQDLKLAAFIRTKGTAV
jgi:hemerythrin